MTKRLFFTAALMLTAVSVTAGIIANGTGLPSGCGTEPAIPVIDSSSVDASAAKTKPDKK